jgi:hypothetical protein
METVGEPRKYLHISVSQTKDDVFIPARAIPARLFRPLADSAKRSQRFHSRNGWSGPVIKIALANVHHQAFPDVYTVSTAGATNQNPKVFRRSGRLTAYK